MDNMATSPYAFDIDQAERGIRSFADNAEFLEETFREYLLLIECSTLKRNLGRGGKRAAKAADLATKAAQHEQLHRENDRRLSVSDECALPFINLVKNCGLNETARHILWLLFFQAVAPDFDMVAEMKSLATGGRQLRARDIVRILAPSSLDEQMKIAGHFGVNSPLVKYRLIEMDTYEAKTFLDIGLSIPARVAKYIANDDTEYDLDNAFIIERPEVPLSFVVLPEDQKAKVVTFIENHEKSMKRQEELGLDRVLTYGRGLAILLYGSPGTGKTLLAKAIATHTGRPLLSIRSSGNSAFGVLSDRYIGSDDIEELFREARMRDGIVFLDECEQYCSRNNRQHYAVLREIEHTDCIVILTTNRPQDLSVALDRRIALKIHFQVPDMSLRRQIWSMHLPKSLPLASDVNIEEIAERYQLTGGYIKNAVLSAINIASSRNGNKAFALTAEDIKEGARLQQKHLGGLSGLVVNIDPSRDIRDINLSGEAKETADRIMRVAENHRSLLSSIRLINSSVNKGYKVLFFGPSFQTALDCIEAIASRLNTGLSMIPFSKLLLQNSDFEKEEPDFIRSRAHEIASIAGTTGHMLVLTDPARSMETLQDDDLKKAGEFLSHFRDHDGIMFMVSASRKPQPVLMKLFHQCVCFESIPAPERLKCWEKVTEGIALDGDVDLPRIADTYELEPEQIQNALYVACLLSAGESSEGKICNRLLEKGIRNVLSASSEVRPLFGAGIIK